MTDTNQLPCEHEAFEAFAQNCPMGKYSTTRRGDGYDSSHTQLMWDTWQARAILALRPVQVPMSKQDAWDNSPVNSDWEAVDAYLQGIEDAEAHHGITAQAKKETP